MHDTQLFKSSFWMGRLIWVKGGDDYSRDERLKTMLLGCGIFPFEMFRLDAEQFVDMFSRGFSKELLKRYEVVLVSGFENLNGDQAIRFLNSVQSFCDLQMGHSLQIILNSSCSISPALKRFKQFKPVEILIDSESEDPGEMNERVQDLIEIATKLTGVPIWRLTERAAVFLESFVVEEGDYEALLLITLGLGRAKNRELRLLDLIPPKRPNDGQLNGAGIARF